MIALYIIFGVIFVFILVAAWACCCISAKADKYDEIGVGKPEENDEIGK